MSVMTETPPPRSSELAEVRAYAASKIATIAIAIAIVLVLPVLAKQAAIDWYIYIARTTLIFAVLVAALLPFTRVTTAAVTRVRRLPLSLLAGLFLVAASLAALFVFDSVPHVSDEVAYQFQARAMAAGHLSISPPANFDFFSFLHTINDGTRWYGIMNPGWPALLAVGYVIHAPWLVNPLLGAATLLLFFSFLRRAGYEDFEARLAVLLLAISPFVIFMSGTLMSHAANLFLFVLFLWAWISLIKTDQWRYALLAGVVVAANIVVRPLDTAAVSAPFLVYYLVHVVRRPRLWPQLIALGLLAALGIVVTALYNFALTGDWRLMPTTKYFVELNPNEKFGLGFGADMGTKLHGPEWPGYYPIDSIWVTGLRVMELLKNLYGMPLIVGIAMMLGLRARAGRRRDPIRLLLLISAVLLVGLYVLHFYHGIAYGSRHYYLALPAIVVLLARPLAAWIDGGGEKARRLPSAVLAATILFTLTVPHFDLIPEYGRNYRGASAVLREAVQQRNLTNAVVLVSQDTRTWAWKSAFPLNEYPLEQSDVVFAKDLGPENVRLMRDFPGRRFYRAWVRRDRVELEPVAVAP